MSVQSEIEKELLSATKMKSKKDEDRQSYLVRLMRSGAKLADADWEALSSEAQDWNNGAAESHKGGRKIDDFPDLPEVDEEPEEVVEEKIPEKPKAERVGRKSSACHVIKTMVVRKPSISVAELIEKLKGKSLKISDVTVATIRSDTRDTLRVLNELELGTFHLAADK